MSALSDNDVRVVGHDGWGDLPLTSQDDFTDTGVIWYINSLLHPRGLALSVDADASLTLTSTDGTEGICFRPETVDEKLVAFEQTVKVLRAAAEKSNRP